MHVDRSKEPVDFWIRTERKSHDIIMVLLQKRCRKGLTININEHAFTHMYYGPQKLNNNNSWKPEPRFVKSRPLYRAPVAPPCAAGPSRPCSAHPFFSPPLIRLVALHHRRAYIHTVHCTVYIMYSLCHIWIFNRSHTHVDIWKINNERRSGPVLTACNIQNDVPKTVIIINYRASSRISRCIINYVVIMISIIFIFC